MTCRNCGRDIEPADTLIGNVVEALDACTECAPQVISDDRMVLKEALRHLTEIKQLARRPTETDLEAMDIPLDEYADAGLLGIANARLLLIATSVRYYLRTYGPMIPGRKPSEKVTS